MPYLANAIPHLPKRLTFQLRNSSRLIQLAGQIRHWQQIVNDPPDAAFQQLQPFVLAEPLDTESKSSPSLSAVFHVANAFAAEAALSEGLLHSLERYQGADVDDDGEWALIHARGIRDHSRLLAQQLSVTVNALSRLDAAIALHPGDLDTLSADLEKQRSRIVQSGFTDDEQRELRNVGLSNDDIADLRAELTKIDYSFSRSDFNDTTNGLIAAYTAFTTALNDLELEMDGIVAFLEAQDLPDHTPAVNAGGPYIVDEGVSLTLDGTASTDPDGTIVAYDWDLDLDGAFDDATGAFPIVNFDRPVDAVIGLRVTDDTGRGGIGYTRLTVNDVKSVPSIDSFDPADLLPDVDLGDTATFTIVTSDPDGDLVGVEWFVDDASVGAGNTFDYQPTSLAEAGIRSVRVVATDDSPLGGSTAREWVLDVVAPDADNDGWTANVDCDEADDAINPGATEIVGNGIDDDCNSQTADSTDTIFEADETNNVIHSGTGSTYQPPVADWQPLVQWQWDDAKNSIGVLSTPAVAPLADTNGDGLINERDVPAVIVATSGNPTASQVNELVALRGDTGEVIFQVSHPDGPGGSWSSSGETPAVGDIDGDGVPEILIAGFLRNPLYAFNNDGTLKWALDNRSALDAGTAGPLLADLDGDGLSEILYGKAAVNSDGALRWVRDPTGGPPTEAISGSPQVVDLDLDGAPEIVAGPTVFDRDGQRVWSWKSVLLPGGEYSAQLSIGNGPYVEQFQTDTGLAQSWTAVANLDADAEPEIIAISSVHESMWIFEHDGQIHAGPFNLYSDVVNQVTFDLGAPTVADFDGDGQVEIAVAATANLSSPTVNDPDRVIMNVYEADGSLVWQKDLVSEQTTNYAPPSSALDFDGDGTSELVVLDPQKLYILNGQDGATLFEMGVDRNNAGGPDGYATIADVDNDGNAEIIVPTKSGHAAGAPPRKGVLVLGDAKDNWIHSRRIWNQWQYEVTNVNEDASIPATARNSWQENNSQRGQIPIEGLDLFAAPDLSASRVTINALNCPAGAGITARLGNGGSIHVAAGMDVNFYLGDPSSGGTLIGTVSTSQLPASMRLRVIPERISRRRCNKTPPRRFFWVKHKRTPSRCPTPTPNDTHTAVINWGDGSLQETVELKNNIQGFGVGFPSHIYASAGNFDMTACVTDDRGLGSCNTISVAVAGLNAPPTADAGGPYTAQEGADITLDASGSSDPDSNLLLHEWDLDDDGQFNDASGSTPTLRWTDLVALGLGDDRVKDKLQGSKKARDLFFADLDSVGDDDDKLTGANDDILIELDELLVT